MLVGTFNKEKDLVGPSLGTVKRRAREGSFTALTSGETRGPARISREKSSRVMESEEASLLSTQYSHDSSASAN